MDTTLGRLADTWPCGPPWSTWIQYVAKARHKCVPRLTHLLVFAGQSSGTDTLHRKFCCWVGSYDSRHIWHESYQHIGGQCCGLLGHHLPNYFWVHVDLLGALQLHQTAAHPVTLIAPHIIDTHSHPPRLRHETILLGLSTACLSFKQAVTDISVHIAAEACTW